MRRSFGRLAGVGALIVFGRAIVGETVEVKVFSNPNSVKSRSYFLMGVVLFGMRIKKLERSRYADHKQ